ncbi:hypothetical protein ABT294_14220 [Nonomuraea sp. NPDC000554]|uniref:hypothetical protein n=1 Tax=Nonomuraea sp. NPDC000554 TaxID=3154259 RepID=UPI00332B4C4C
MRDGVLGDLVKGQLCLFGGLTTCLVAMPDCLTVNCGMSDFGVHWRTIVPYAIGFLGAALFTRRALRAAAPDLRSPGFVRRAGDSFAVLLTGVLLTPYTLAEPVHWIHRLFGAGLFLHELILAILLVTWARADAAGVVLVAVQVGSGVLSGIYVLSTEGHLVLGQAAFQLAFGVIAIRSLRLLRAGPKPGEPSAGQSFTVK